ncbi:MAG: hypothetical protein HY445_02485 [Candidatus Niyogibacteria bacterium]|nr:hypothetical protein [Candidatus Niyogibacteria bacterium]
MDIVELRQKEQTETTCTLKENFMCQLLAHRALGGIEVKELKAQAIKLGVLTEEHLSCCIGIDDAVNELIREDRARIALIGDDIYLWLHDTD